MHKKNRWNRRLKLFFSLKMLALQFRFSRMQNEEYMLLPAVQVADDMQKQPEFYLLLSHTSPMRYLLIHKKEDNQYDAGLMERGPNHKKSSILDQKMT